MYSTLFTSGYRKPRPGFFLRLVIYSGTTHMWNVAAARWTASRRNYSILRNNWTKKVIDCFQLFQRERAPGTCWTFKCAVTNSCRSRMRGRAASAELKAGTSAAIWWITSWVSFRRGGQEKRFSCIVVDKTFFPEFANSKYCSCLWSFNQLHTCMTLIDSPLLKNFITNNSRKYAQNMMIQV